MGGKLSSCFTVWIVILAIVVFSQSRLVEKRRYTKADPIKCNILKLGPMPPEVKGNDTLILCNCTMSFIIIRKECIEYQEVSDDNSTTTTTQRSSSTSSTTARTWRPSTRSTTTRGTTTSPTTSIPTTRFPTSSSTTFRTTSSTRFPTSSSTLIPTTSSTTFPTTSSTTLPTTSTATIPTTSSTTSPTTTSATTTTSTTTTTTQNPITSTAEPTTYNPTSTVTSITDVTSERTANKGFVPLSRDENKDQIFVQGHWYNKDGTTNKGHTAAQGTQISAQSTFQQCMHHGTNGCDQTWSQRYWVNSDYWSPGNPIFIEIAGEWDAEGDINGGYWYNYAYKYKAMLVVLEHRFYGQSFPVNNPAVSDLWLMTSQLALADAAYFIDTYTQQNNLQGSSWVAFGCSYGGNLAAWMKLKYPNHVKTAVSSSGPVEAIYDFPGYIQTVSEVIQQTDSGCYDYLYNTFGCMEAFVNGSTSSCGPYKTIQDLKAALKYCYYVDPNGNTLSRQQMFNYLAYPPWADNAPGSKASSSCQKLRASNGADGIQFYGNFMQSSGLNGGCSSGTLEDQGAFLQTQEAWQTGAAGWTWQTCNEFGYFMSSDPVRGTFGRNTFSGDVYGSTCQRQFGDTYNREYVEGQIANTNAYYGGKNIQSKCVIFVHGTWDPWHSQGVTTPTGYNTVVVVPGTEHCADTGNPTNSAMSTAQQTISSQLGQYLNDPNC
ncbi:putative serine protease K12H4.7 [Folsomia candida]|uniref:putative serine protease K12H4.7 n=1 Tax=Folsomia candida TaxID=158441 RepID=UPI000B903B08|nr:putative serine protease K12H4.7 [Folsomia candida]